MTGILIMDKPSGWTSFDVLAKLRGILGTRRLGHSGTLDPLATGVLPVFVGEARKAVDMQSDHDKTYRATLRLGVRTDTGDVTGTVLEQAPVQVGEREVQAVLPRFVGEQMQLPPMYSAVKVNGVPLYKAARKGQQVERTPRPVTVYSIRYLGRSGADEYILEIACSKGTYIRVLLEEIGAALGVPATMSALRRTRAGIFGQEQACTLEQVQHWKEEGTLEAHLLPLDGIFGALPSLTVTARIREHLLNGCPTSHFPAQDGRYRVYDAENCFLGLARVEERVLKVEKLFVERG